MTRRSVATWLNGFLVCLCLFLFLGAVSPHTICNGPGYVGGDLVISGKLTVDSIVASGAQISDCGLNVNSSIRALDTLRTAHGPFYCGGTKIDKIDGTTGTLNFSAPGAVPGNVDLTMTLAGAAIGDQVLVAGPVSEPTGFSLRAFVSATNTVTVRWVQYSGAAADPDGGGGGTYKVRFLR